MGGPTGGLGGGPIRMYSNVYTRIYAYIRRFYPPRIYAVCSAYVYPAPGRRGLAGTAAEGEASSWRAAQLAAEIKELIARHAPEKLDGVPTLLKKHAGREQELLQKVKAKYSAK